MAAASSATKITDISVDNLVKCAICLDLYDDPRCLPCSHTYCYKCIVNLCVEGLGQCPMRDNTFISPSIISKLPINRVAKDLVECIQKSAQPKVQPSIRTKCDVCKKVVCEFMCETCAKHYCTVCLKLLHDIDEFKTHKMNILVDESSSNFCSEHVDEKQKYWCSSCEKTVCSDCLLFEHKNHPFVTLEDVSQIAKTQFNSSAQRLTSIQEDLEKLNEKTTEAFHNHYQTHVKTKHHIENTINQLQKLLEENKKYLISTLSKNDALQQKIIRAQKQTIEDNLKSAFIRTLFTKQVLKIDNNFQLMKMKNDTINYNQLVEEQSKLLLHGFTFDIQSFITTQSLLKLQADLEYVGHISTETFFVSTSDTRPLLKLSKLDGEEINQEFQGTYAYGYRFQLKAPLTLNAVLVKVASFNVDFTVFILDNDDIVVQRKVIKTNDNNSTACKWITIPIAFELKQNYYIFIWAKPTGKHSPLISCRGSTHNLRQINEHVSVRSKRAQIDPLKNDDINTELNVIYDTLLSNDERNQTIPAIEMILDT
ncbi:unnamed protein product [Rotaria magnacalcarata]|uniref:Uncharacterized protein n=3 Tax=Rotaria magnacalcarata TaxID=392030 RepID=A0A816UA11_9BILA|nr:unnamed protein product [Rotaria magnacalcarata]CAF1653698.1 unnamed protein product [Rotaria magnacalcarata]CAF2106549.1 unnamed protein product [Rotaria magnacalcarata]CAF4092376.1 unnamed protein product [Rotaria magnacalcarata]CAF4112294.1 unnamed protein product [Rotaria magnacalcarata]